jgi:hypothetical protein
MSEFRGWKVKGKRMGLQSQRDANILRVATSACEQGGENVGLLMHLFDDGCALCPPP